MKKIYLLTDGCGWIVDRISAKIATIPDFEFEIGDYVKTPTDVLIEKANNSDLIHYNNWDASYHHSRLNEINVPFLYTIRSHRYPEYTKQVYNWATKTMVITPMLLSEFPNATYIPDGVFDEFYSTKPFVVGYAGMINEYKGVHLIERACRELGCELKIANGIDSKDMVDFYNSIDLYVCASVAEGHSTPVMECMAMNKPVVTVKVGLPSTLNANFIEERTVEGIKKSISKFYTRPQVEQFKWDNVLEQIKNLYNSMI